MREWKAVHTFRGIVMGSLTADPLKPSLRSATAHSQEMQLLSEDGILNTVLKRMQDVGIFLYNGLEEVYSKNDREMIEHIRVVLDLAKVVQLTKEMSPAVVTMRTVKKILDSAVVIDQDFDMKYEKGEIREQYRVFVEKISEISKIKDSEKFSSIDVMVMMMNTEGKKYRGCEAVMDILCQAATKKLVESVMESWISVLEHHSSKSRQLKAETIKNEIMIAVNGPLIQHSEGVVDESMKVYWSQFKNSLKNGHFTRKSGHIKSYTISKTIDSLNSKVVKNPFIM